MPVLDEKKENPSPWGGEEKMPFEREKERSRSRLWFLAIVAVLVATGAVYYVFFRGNPAPNVGLAFSKPSQVLVGDPFTLTVSVSNYSNAVLKDGKLSIFLPDGASFVGQSSDQRVMEEVIGDLGPGSDNQQNFNLIVTADPQSVKHVQAKFTYDTGAVNSGAQYETDGATDFVVGQPAVSLTVSAPQNTYSGQDFSVAVSYVNATGHDFSNVHLRLNYPPTFQFKQSTVSPESSGNNSWNLGTLAARAQGTITITGDMVGQDNSNFGFVGNATADFLGTTYTVNTQTASVAITPAPLVLSLNINNSTDYIAVIGDTLNYVLSYKNNYNVTLNNATINVALVGDLYDMTSLRTDGNFNSLSNTITWQTSNNSALAAIQPGQSGQVSFSIHLKNTFPIHLLSDKNYVLKVQAQMTSPTVPPNTAAQQTISVSGISTKVSGQITIVAKGLWRDAASGILNSGPYPPVVNQATDYTIHWLVTNYATDVSNIQISAFLQNGARFTGTVQSNVSGSVPVYNANTGQVSWTVPALAATTGVIGPPAEAIFQIENTPNVNQAGQYVTLLSQTNIQAQDSFTNATLQNSAPAVDTSLPYDTTVSTYIRTVQK